MRKFFLILIAAASLNSCPMHAEPNTFVQYRFQSPTTVFDTKYSIDPTAAESFLVDVATQRSLGTFQKTTVGATDEFIPAINKRLTEFQQISDDLRKKAEKPLPGLVVQKVSIVSLDDVILSPDSNVSSDTKTEYNMTTRISEVRRLMQGADTRKGLAEFTALEQLVQGSPSNSRIRSYANELDSVRKDFFTPEGVLKGKQISNISKAFQVGNSRDRFIVNLINRCVTSAKCDQEKFRQISAILSLFADSKEAIKLKLFLDSTDFELSSETNLKSIVDRFAAASKLAETCRSSQSCDESIRVLKATSVNIFKLSDFQANELIGLIYP